METTVTQHRAVLEVAERLIVVGVALFGVGGEAADDGGVNCVLCHVGHSFPKNGVLRRLNPCGRQLHPRGHVRGSKGPMSAF